MAMLEVRDLNVWYGLTEVLRSVSFDAPAGRVTALLGGNGSGKTTVLNTVCGLIKARAGSIRAAGRELAGLSTDQVVRLGVVQVPQGREVFASMTVRDNLELGASTRSEKAAIGADVEEMCAMFPVLQERRARRASTLSGGEQQQLAIARALMARPKLLLMDEPSAGLAPVVVQEMITLIKRLRDERGLTILLVEQNVGIAAAVGETAHVLQNGEIVYTGPAPELVANPEVLASYLGR
jgi:branched-chain amino acid transport system ATP-binding protein